MRLLAAALAGGIGAFGIAAGTHVPAAPPAVAAPSVAVTPDSTPD